MESQGRLRNRTEAFRRNLMEPHGSTWNMSEGYRTLWNLMESYGTVWNSMEHYGKLWNSIEGSGTFQKADIIIIVNRFNN